MAESNAMQESMAVAGGVYSSYFCQRKMGVYHDEPIERRNVLHNTLLDLPR